MAARVVPVDPFDLVVFGGTGDLARRKLLPALYHRMMAGQIIEGSRIVAAARRDLDAERYRHMARDALEEMTDDQERLSRFLAALDYVRIDATGEEGWPDLAARLRGSERTGVHYLSVAPHFFGSICEKLAASGCLTPRTRLVVEKPLGRDLASAQALNLQLSTIFAERQIYRIDHYLGKETVQNLMALRFANALFEPIWNARHVDHVQITVAERVGVGGRGTWYDQNGALRDMMQNHLLQLLCLTAMEPPASFDPDAVRDEKLKVLRCLKPVAIPDDVVCGQYLAANGDAGYLEDVGNADSRTESFVALKTRIANWRWNGTPFYLRTGKRLRVRMSEIAVVFKDAPHAIFHKSAGRMQPNVLAIRLQPDEGITLKLMIKEPGPGGMRLREAPLDMTFAETMGVPDLRIPDAYERLIMDVVRGDQTLFMRNDEVEAAWAWIDPIIAACQESTGKPQPYDSYSSGPKNARALMQRDRRSWLRDGSPVIEIRDRLALARTLADEVANALSAAIDRAGRATLAVPGGSTPANFLRHLGRRPLDWSRVTVTLTDERCVPENHLRSNRSLLTRTLFAGAAGAAGYLAPDDPALEEILPLDACVLGMGEDLHTASLFPGADRLAEALAETAPTSMRMRAPAASEERITLTAPVLSGAARCFILICGPGKYEALARARATTDLIVAPVRILLDGPRPAAVYWAP